MPAGESVERRDARPGHGYASEGLRGASAPDAMTSRLRGAICDAWATRFAAGRAGPKLAALPSMSDTNKSESVDLSSLTQLRDEIRVRVHLAQLDAKEKWEELETKFASLEHKVTSEGGSVIGATAQLAKELKQSLVDFRQRLSS